MCRLKVPPKGSAQKTPDLASIVQEVIDRPGWTSGNAMAFIITGSGTRVAAAFENSSYDACELVLEYDSGGGPNVPPTVSITNPTDGSLYTSLSTITIDADASDPDGSVTQVEFFVDGTSIGTDNTSPYSINWTPGSFGTYSLTAEATDDSSATTLSAPISVEFSDMTETTVTLQVGSSSDDAEEDKRGNMRLTDATLELTKPSNRLGNQDIGLRFTSTGIPNGATIVSANLEFVANSSTNASGGKTIYGHDVNNSGTFTSSSGNISSRTKTSASVSWSPGTWSSGSTYNTPDITNVIQEIVDRPGYASTSAISIIITGSGRRDATSFNGNAANAPKLIVTYLDPVGAEVVIEESIEFSLFPNPADNVIHINMVQESGNNDVRAEREVNISIIDAGQRVHYIQQWNMDSQSQFSVPIDHMPSGVYWLTISENGKTLSHKPFVKR